MTSTFNPHPDEWNRLPALPVADERARFEQWATTEMKLGLGRASIRPDSRYNSPLTYFAWEGFRAALALPAGPPPTDAQLIALVYDTPATAAGLLPSQRIAAINLGRSRYAAFLAAAGTDLDHSAQRVVGQPDAVDGALRLLREARATLEMWKDVAPAVSLCKDIDIFLKGQQ